LGIPIERWFKKGLCALLHFCATLTSPVKVWTVCFVSNATVYTVYARPRSLHTTLPQQLEGGSAPNNKMEFLGSFILQAAIA
jgi:hypothetical protein